MNFDVNTLSTLMQLMNSQKPRESESNYPANDSSENYYQNTASSQNKSQSVFATQNGLGQRVNFESKSEKKSQSASNPMSAIFDMMGGKGGGASADMMTNLLPMFMNMMSKPAQVAGGVNKNDSKNNQSFEQKLKSAMDSASGNETSNSSATEKDITKSGEPSRSGFVRRNENAQNRQSNQPKSNFNRDKYSPISFAGYALICALNKLYSVKRFEYSN